LVDRVKDDAEKLKAENPSAPIPVDLVTTSASGLDPDITPAAAEFQIPRVAKARNLPGDKVQALVDRMTQDRFLGILGEKRVNVLKLNLALDQLH
jgi:K+-transporting ATPase ATPase C chain